jgi:hypothetical protein
MKYQIEEHPHFIKNEINKFFPCTPKQIENVFHKLQQRETFVDGQIPPYKVEFDSKLQSGPFEEGELNIHHGPLLSVHGIIGKISDNYRDLRYFYGSYILSFRLIRPIRLEFFKEENGIRLKVTCLVKPWFVGIWQLLNNIFWKFFGISFLF